MVPSNRLPTPESTQLLSAPLSPKHQGYCTSQRVPVCLSPVRSVAKLSGGDHPPPVTGLITTGQQGIQRSTSSLESASEGHSGTTYLQEREAEPETRFQEQEFPRGSLSGPACLGVRETGWGRGKAKASLGGPDAQTVPQTYPHLEVRGQPLTLYSDLLWPSPNLPGIVAPSAEGTSPGNGMGAPAQERRPGQDTTASTRTALSSASG